MLKKRLLVTLIAGAIAVAPAGTAQAREVVKADNLRFRPDSVHVSKGEKVVWKNTDNIKHTVTATSSNWSKDVVIRPGDTTSFTFNRGGTYRYKCRFHAAQGMKGKVEVG